MMTARRRFETGAGPDADDGPAVRVLPDLPPAVIPPAPTGAPPVSLVVPLLVGAAVTVAIGAYARVHQPTGIAVNVAGFSSPQTVKVWLGSGAAALAVVQLCSALAMWGRLGGFSPSWAGAAHRWSGRAAFLLTVPVAVHCLYALGFADHDLPAAAAPGRIRLT